MIGKEVDIRIILSWSTPPQDKHIGYTHFSSSSGECTNSRSRRSDLLLFAVLAESEVAMTAVMLCVFE